MVRLNSKFPEESLHKITNWEAKTALEMRHEHNILTGSDDRRELSAGQPALHLRRDPPRSAEPLDLVVGDIGALLGRSHRPCVHLLLAVLGDDDITGSQIDRLIWPRMPHTRSGGGGGGELVDPNGEEEEKSRSAASETGVVKMKNNGERRRRLCAGYGEDEEDEDEWEK